MNRLIAAVLTLCGTACTVPSLDELYDCDSLKPNDVAGGNADAVIGGNRCTALRVGINHADFSPGCMTLTVEDTTNPTRTETTEVHLDGAQRNGTRRVVVFGHKGWGQTQKLTARAYETTCGLTLVAQDATTVAMPPLEASGDSRISDVALNLQAEDLDEDGYVAKTGSYPGTDCNDTKGIGASIHPGALELCNGIDNNCSGDESDAIDQIQYYPDLDGDGYGDSSVTAEALCLQPVGMVNNNRDCDDNRPFIHPDQDELFCDGRDDNCNDLVDDAPLDVGTTCVTSTGCVSTKICSVDGVNSVCTHPDDSSPWYVDADGDGLAGTLGALGCAVPNDPTATREPSDCDDSSKYAGPGKAEVCDRIDNNCNSTVDDNDICAGSGWGGAVSVGGAGTVWNAVAPYAHSKAWLAGDGDKLLHVDGSSGTNVFTPATACGTLNWKSAWADSTGRVFAGSSNGKFTTHLHGSSDACVVKDGPGGVSVNGMIGFEQGSNRLIYAVDSQGRIILWDYEAGTITELDRVTSNLKAIHGTSPSTLLAVGVDEGPNPDIPTVWSPPAAGTGAWVKEALSNTGNARILRAVQVLTPRLAYVIGEEGLVLERSNGTWATKPAVTHPDNGSVVTVRALMAFSSKAMYVVTSDTLALQFFNGISWTPVFTAPATINSLAGTSPGELWGAGSAGSFIRWQPGPP